MRLMEKGQRWLLRGRCHMDGTPKASLKRCASLPFLSRGGVACHLLGWTIAGGRLVGVMMASTTTPQRVPWGVSDAGGMRVRRIWTRRRGGCSFPPMEAGALPHVYACGNGHGSAWPICQRWRNPESAGACDSMLLSFAPRRAVVSAQNRFGMTPVLMDETEGQVTVCDIPRAPACGTRWSIVSSLFSASVGGARQR